MPTSIAQLPHAFTRPRNLPRPIALLAPGLRWVFLLVLAAFFISTGLSHPRDFAVGIIFVCVVQTLRTLAPWPRDLRTWIRWSGRSRRVLGWGRPTRDLHELPGLWIGGLIAIAICIRNSAAIPGTSLVMTRPWLLGLGVLIGIATYALVTKFLWPKSTLFAWIQSRHRANLPSAMPASDA